MLPQLRRLEETYPDDVVVVGVHSPKFPAERDLANVRAALLALEVDHPVVNDPDHRIWDAYAVRAWPTLMFVDPLGRVIAKQEGEHREDPVGRRVIDVEKRVRREHAEIVRLFRPKASGSSQSNRGLVHRAGNHGEVARFDRERQRPPSPCRHPA